MPILGIYSSAAWTVGRRGLRAALRLVCLETCHSEGFWLAADHHICAWRITGGHRLVDGRFRPGRTDGGQPYPPGRAFAECVSDYWSRCLGGARSAGACTQSCRATCTSFRTRDSCLRSEEHTSELQSLMRISYAVFCLKK